MRKIILILAMLLLGNFALGQQKNVLLIMADDFNHWLPEIGYYPAAQTPNVSSLANKGVLFAKAYCSSPVCNPSRNSMWSGLRPSTTGITSNSGGYVRDIAGFENVVTMNQYFKQNNYWTYGGGKLYHPGSMGSSDTDPTNWSALYTGNSGAQGGSFYSYEVGSGSPIKWSAGNYDVSTSNDTQLAQHMADQITNYNKNQPFFMGVGLFRPHLPWNCPKEFYDQFNPTQLPIPDGYSASDGSPSSEHTTIVNDGQWSNALRAYLANLAYADYNIGIILDALENSPHKDNTIVLFMGDHGWHLGEKKRWKKSSVYEQANHTTLIIYDPSASGNQQVSQKVVSLQDVYPTLIELCNLSARSDVQGNSLQPLLNNPNQSSWDKPVFATYGSTNYIRTNQWKYISDGGNSQLYDVQADPYEWNNLYGNTAYNTIINDLQQQIDDMLLEGQQLVIGGGGCTAITDITDLSAVQNGCNTVDLSWSAAPCAIEYIVRRKIVGEATYANLATVTTTSFSDNTVVLGTSYEYQVRPYDGTTKKVSNNPVVNMPITCGTTGLFHIFNKNFGKKIRPYSGGVSQVEAGSIGTWTQWEQVPTSSGYFRLQNQGSLQYLSMPDATDEAMITTSTATTAQEEWKTVETGDGYFHLENRASGKRIRSTSVDDYSTNPTGDHTVKVAPSSATGDWTRWEFVSVGGARIAALDIIGEQFEMKVYPNPSRGRVKIELPIKEVVFGHLFDVNGKMVKNFTLKQGTAAFTTKELKPGFYLIRLSTAEGPLIQKLLIE
ncbi:sulfatase-like hydrolase/transferase [Limibacter armeniacum]|uniref:sulfatase-like hydrolase/transferase n=1 Tax=Limibacter armeniacum TaxID=466084 RepID=UPI002FE533E4